MAETDKTWLECSIRLKENEVKVDESYKERISLNISASPQVRRHTPETLYDVIGPFRTNSEQFNSISI